MKTTAAITDEDQAFGYPFGCDGLVRLREAMQHLGIARDAAYAYKRQKLLRIKTLPGQGGKRGPAMVCRRSLENFKQRMS